MGNPMTLEKLGHDAASHVAGVQAVQHVEVVSGEDRDGRPVYYFSIVINEARAQQRAGLVRTRLVQKLRDDLIARGDAHLPVIRILNETEWTSRTGAGTD